MAYGVTEIERFAEPFFRRVFQDYVVFYFDRIVYKASRVLKGKIGTRG